MFPSDTFTLISTAKKPANITKHWKTSVQITALRPPWKITLVLNGLCKRSASRQK